MRAKRAQLLVEYIVLSLRCIMQATSLGQAAHNACSIPYSGKFSFRGKISLIFSVDSSGKNNFFPLHIDESRDQGIMTLLTALVNHDSTNSFSES